jgi:hypothetical protein
VRLTKTYDALSHFLPVLAEGHSRRPLVALKAASDAKVTRAKACTAAKAKAKAMAKAAA